MLGRMLTVRIYGHRMGEPACMSQTQAMQDGGALAAISRQHTNAQIRVVGSDAREFVAGAVGAAIDDNPDRPILSADCCDGVEQPCAGVVAGNDHHMSGGGGAAAVQTRPAGPTNSW